jgi:tRNA 2-thiouridine synthesizing protein A
VSPTPQEVNPPLGQAPIEVDARGLRCPLPVIRLAEVARDAPPGTCIVVLATDPAARHDIPAWCRMRHHELAELSEVFDPATGTSATSVSAQEASTQTAGAQTAGAQTAGAQTAGAQTAGAQTAGAQTAGAQTQGAPPAYLRFVVRLLPQPAKAGGSGSGRERPSRAM